MAFKNYLWVAHFPFSVFIPAIKIVHKSEKAAA